MSDERLKILGLNIKIARLNANLSQEQLAEKIGVSRETISMLENGNQNTSVVKILDIAGVLKVEISQLFKDI